MRTAAATILLAVAAATAGVGAHGQERADVGERPTIVMGMRIDAPPFAWRDANGGYSGFLYNLCVDAAARAAYPVGQVVPIDAEGRRAFFEGRGPALDVLSDPTTITLTRIAELEAVEGAGLEFSPIVFVANGSYVLHPDRNKGRLMGREELPCVTAPPAGEGDEAAGEVVRLAAGFVIGTTAEELVREAIRAGALALEAGEMVCLVEKRTHWEAAEAFCAGELRYYFGDQDILRSVLEMTAERRDDCPSVPDALPLSYEPYAFVLSGRTAGFRQDFIRSLYELFHHEPAERRFERSFEGRAMSPFLRTLFRINTIPAGVRSPEAPRPVASGQDVR